MKGTPGFTGTNIRSEVSAGDENRGVVAYAAFEATGFAEVENTGRGGREAGRPGAVLSRPTGRRCCFNARGRRALLGATDRNPTAGYGMEQQECE